MVLQKLVWIVTAMVEYWLGLGGLAEPGWASVGVGGLGVDLGVGMARARADRDSLAAAWGRLVTHQLLGDILQCHLLLVIVDL